MATKKKAVSKTVYRSTITGGLISKKKALKLNKSLYTVEEMATSGNKPTRTRTVYRNNATGELISKADALKLAASTYTVEQMAIKPNDPLLHGLNLDLTGNWGADPEVTVDAGSNEKRGTVRVKSAGGAVGAGWTLTFKHAKSKAPFALVHCQDKRECTHVTSKEALTVTSSGYDSAAGVVFDYLITD